jgi:predicted GNAT superfamily acetyltransferase
MTPPFSIRALSSIEDFHQAEEVQRRAWYMSDSLNIVPLNALLPIQKYGGLVAGAFEASGEMIGFVFGFLGLTKQGGYKHCSHMLGVVPEAKSRNVGYALKCFQRQYTLAQGFDLITWTYDPLESANAKLNIVKLGCIARIYHRNFYGAWDDSINRGLETDRFEVEWHTKSVRVEAALSDGGLQMSYAALIAEGASVGLAAQPTANDVTEPALSNAVSGAVCLLHVPTDFQKVKQADFGLALAWRAASRQAFEAMFAQGYAITHFVRGETPLYNAYVLTRLSD